MELVCFESTVKCGCFSIVLAVPISGIIYYSIMLFVNTLENLVTQVEQIGWEGDGGKLP